MPTPLSVTDDAPDVEFDDVTFSYPAASEVSLASLESIARTDTATEP